jgi:hypothetical protein
MATAAAQRQHHSGGHAWAVASFSPSPRHARICGDLEPGVPIRGSRPQQVTGGSAHRRLPDAEQPPA